jgi:hypothetical protein
MAVPFTLIGGDSKVEPTIDDIFAVLTSNLYLIKSCKIKSVNELKINIHGNVIRTHIFRFQGVALSYIDTSLQSITDIKSLGDKVVDNIKKDIIEELDDISEEQNRGNAMSIINSAVENTEAELISLRNELIERTALLETTVKDKVKLNLSVDEIGLLFRSLKDAGIIEIDTVTGLARFIAQNFESKLMGNLSTNNLYNKITTPVGKSAPAVLAKLDEVANAVKKIREK